MSVVKINAVDVSAEAGPELERRFAARAGVVDKSPGFLGFQLLRPVRGRTQYFVVTHWTDDASYEAWRDGDARAAHKGEHGRSVVAANQVMEFELVLDVKPS